jgi:hypothetical protein
MIFEIPLCFFDGRPEAQVHGAEDNQTPSQMKWIEDPFQHGGNGIKRPVHLPETLLEFFYGHPFRLKDDRGHIIFRPVLCQNFSFLF